MAGNPIELRATMAEIAVSMVNWSREPHFNVAHPDKPAASDG